MANNTPIERYETSSGITVFRLPVEAFSDHITNCYLVLDDAATLIDAGSGDDKSNSDLLAAFDTLKSDFGETVRLSDVGRLIITHGHVDHFGGVNFVHEHADAKLGIHALDASILTHFDERLIVASKNLHVYLDRAGLSPEKVDHILNMNKWSKGMFHSDKVHFTFDEGPIDGTPFTAYHTPGHCPGQVCLHLDDILFTADHVLSYTTPTQSPEFIYRYTGLGHYYESLRKICNVDNVRIGLGGHEDTMDDVAARTEDIIAYHDRRLEKTLAICNEPKNIEQISLELFGPRKTYHVLLALLETGAHVEYLYERGQLTVTNLDEVEQQPNPTLLYRQA
jgi:glyoxylase-like metal-dependent hydrolase (beta-lactamase superfamily II)